MFNFLSENIERIVAVNASVFRPGARPAVLCPGARARPFSARRGLATQLTYMTPSNVIILIKHALPLHPIKSLLCHFCKKRPS